MASVQEQFERIVANVARVIIGKRQEVELASIALVCQGHVLIEDVPGVGKTMLARSLARTVGASFKRIQFTPDLLPTDVTGVSIFNQKTSEFEYRPGPVVAQVLLADEINRATPKTQSALLEAMEERQVTVDGQTHKLPEPFIVLATQNPIEYEGTFPLPEAQLDRFLIRISLGYPSPAEELAILEGQQIAHPIETLDTVASPEDLLDLRASVRALYVDPLIREYVVALVGATRQHADVYLGASPRGSLAIFRTSQAYAAARGRDFVAPDDVKAMAVVALSHRLIVSPGARIKGTSASSIIEEILDRTPVPGASVRDVGFRRR